MKVKANPVIDWDEVQNSATTIAAFASLLQDLILLLIILICFLWGNKVIMKINHLLLKMMDGQISNSLMVSPFAVHQQQLVYLSQQQQTFPMAAANSGSTPPTFPVLTQQPGFAITGTSNVVSAATNWLNPSFQIPRMMPVDGQQDTNKSSQLDKIMLVQSSEKPWIFYITVYIRCQFDLQQPKR